MVKVISLGGSIIIPKDINVNFLKNFKERISSYLNQNKEDKLILITGGGFTARVYQGAAKELNSNIDIDSLDWIGIRATRINAELIKSIFSDFCKDEIVINPTSNYSFSGRILVACGWKPGFSTDTDATYLAKRFNAKQIINLSNIQKVYTKDPRFNKDAKPIDKISWSDFRKIVGDKWSAGANTPFDPIASKMASEEGIQVICSDGQNIDNTIAILEGKEFIGTTIG